MRTSGSLKSLIHGVTTDKAKVSDNRYLQAQSNMQTVEGSGLHKRPPLEIAAVDLFPTYNDDATTQSILKEFRMDGTDYVMMIQGLRATPASAKTIVVADWDGNIITTSLTAAYFSGVASADDVEFVEEDDEVWVVNKTMITAMDVATRATDKTSLIHVKAAPADSSSFTVSWEDTNDNGFSAIITVGVAISGRGTNVVAALIADEINAEAGDIGVTASSAGSVVIVQRTDSEYAKISVQDEDAGNTIVAINGQLQDIDDLPRWCSSDTQILTIKPEKTTDRGIYYMRSENDLTATTPTIPASDGEFISGSYVNGTYPDRGGSGRDTPNAGFAEYGTWTTQPNIAGDTVEMFTFMHNFNGTGDTQLFISTFEPAFGGNGWPSGTFGRVTVRKKSDLSIVYDSALTPGADEVSWGTGYIINHTISGVATKWLTDTESYYIYFNKTVASQELNQVNWVESSASAIPYKFDATTMPYKLKDVSGTMTQYAPTLEERDAGDNETNPLPAFVGKPLKTLGRFQNRLVTTAGAELIGTETDQPDMWFRNTVTQLLSTHPIRVKSTAAKQGDIKSMVQHNKDLLLFTDKVQYKISGAVALTPQTSGMPVAAEYTNDPTVKPVSLGDSVYFGFSYGKYLGISQYQPDQNDADKDKANTITDHVKKYISGTPIATFGDANTGEYYLVTSDKIYVCDYDIRFSRDEDKRFAWSVWEDFGQLDGWTIVAATYINRDIRLLLEKDDIVMSCVLDTVEDPDSAARRFTLDFLVTDTISGSDTITLDTDYTYDSSLLVTVNDPTHQQFGNLLSYTHAAGVLTIETGFDGVDVTYGYPYRTSVIPQTKYVKDEGGFINSNTHFVIQKWLVHVDRSAQIYGKIISSYYDYDDQYWSGMIAGDIFTQTDNVADNTNVIHFSYKQRPELASFELYTTSHLPASFTQIEWIGNYISRGRRF